LRIRDPGSWIRGFFDPGIREEEEDQFTHMITLDAATTGRSSNFDRCLDSNPESFRDS
jgi:hypothetical protein